MFTGLVKDIGTIKSIVNNKSGFLISIKTENLINKIEIDDSISINGVCQSVVSIDLSKYIFKVQAIISTLEKTNFSSLKFGSKVNLELALRVGDRLGGHLVSGHINTTGRVVKIKSTGESFFINISFSKDIGKYIMSEGSICVDGVSLTIYKKCSTFFTLAVIPHTMKTTCFSFLKIGSMVNIEVDLIAKYLDNIINNTISSRDKISLARIKELGF